MNVRICARLATIALTTSFALPAVSFAAPARTSLTAVEGDVMCTSCREPLALAQSPQAIAERAYISKLIAQGQTKQQIERSLVAQYGTAVLAKPPARGFNLTVYILPPALVVAGVVLLAVTLPRWRRRTRATAGATPQAIPPALSPADATRLDEDLARFD